MAILGSYYIGDFDLASLGDLYPIQSTVGIERDGCVLTMGMGLRGHERLKHYEEPKQSQEYTTQQTSLMQDEHIFNFMKQYSSNGCEIPRTTKVSLYSWSETTMADYVVFSCNFLNKSIQQWATSEYSRMRGLV